VKSLLDWACLLQRGGQESLSLTHFLSISLTHFLSILTNDSFLKLSTCMSFSFLCLLSLVTNSNSIHLYHLLRTLNQKSSAQTAEIRFFSIRLFWILFSISLVLIISLTLFLTHLILLLQLKLFKFYLSNKFISSLFFVHLQFESFHTETKTEKSLNTHYHNKVVFFL
jgi:hypothetical protein